MGVQLLEKDYVIQANVTLIIIYRIKNAKLVSLVAKLARVYYQLNAVFVKKGMH
jgi:hypothetical protein